MDSIHLDFTTLEFREDHVLSHVKEDVVLDHPQVQEMMDICKSYYQGKPFVYISVRLKKYSVNPLTYLKLNNNSSPLGISIVCKGIDTCKNAEFEKNFSKLPFKIYNDVEDAVAWAKKLQKKKKADL